MARWRIGGVILCAFFGCCISGAFGQEATRVKVGYLRTTEQRNAISLIEQPAPNDGLAGAELAIDDNNTTGRFLKQSFSLDDVKLKPGDDPAAAINALADQGVSMVIADLPADLLLKAADAGRAKGMLFFNAGATDDRLREEDCRANVMHVAPTRSMLADGLAQYLVWKTWRKWFFVVGSHAKDKLWGDALKRSATRFGAKIVEERTFADTGGARQTDSGIAQIQRQIPSFTQGAADYDVLVTADESEVFAAYFPYRTYAPRPVAGSAGLVPTSWDPVHGAVGRDPAAEPLHEEVLAAHDGARHAGLVGGADDRRSGDAHEVGRRSDRPRLSSQPGFCAGGFQGTEADASPLELAAAPAHTPERRPEHHVDFSAGRLPASGLGVGYARLRSAGNKVRAQVMAGEGRA